MKYSIIIPAYKEAKYIDDTLDALSVYLLKNNLHKDTEVIVVAANGGDDTATKAKDHLKEFKKLIVHELPNRVGKGRDLREGFMLAKGEYQLFMDADMATPLRHIIPTFRMLEDGADVVIGIRNLSTMHKSMLRKLSSKMSNFAIHRLAVKNVPDTQCGFKAFTKHASKTIFSRTKIQGWGTDIEMLAIAKLHGLNIDGIKVPDWSDPKDENGLAGDSQLKAMKQTFSELLRVRKNIRKGLYL